jgi:two-component system chemotaxis response regulator CheY
MTSSAKPNSNLINDSNSAERLAKARMLVKSVGHILSFYSSAIRAINSAASVLKSDKPQDLNNFAHLSVNTPIGVSPTLCNSFKLAAKELYPKEFQALLNSDKIQIKKVIALFNANEISATLAITYYFKLLAKNIDTEELSRLSPFLSSYIKNGAIIGSQLASSFGRGGGMIACGLRGLGLLTLIKADLKGFKLLRRRIDQSAEIDNFEFELETFGFTHLDVACALAGELGFGAVAREAFITLPQQNAQPSTSLGICWRHTLNEAKKLWQSRIKTNKEKSSLGTLDSVDGFKWLWSQQDSNDILPGLDMADLEDMVEGSESKDTPTLKTTSEIKILIVEDEDTSAKLLAKIIDGLGSVSICHSGEAAVLACKNSSFDLIFLDVGLPGMSGIEFLELYRQSERDSNIPEDSSALILILTADENPQSVMKSFSHGANGYITKPLDIKTISEELYKFGVELKS